MRLSLIGEKSSLRRSLVNAVACGLFLFSVAISAMPGLHEQIHSASMAGHECAVTLLSSGSCDYTPCATPCVAPHPSPPAPSFVTRQSQSPLAALEFSLLEHAPPANS